MKRTKVLFLWARYSGYMAACWRQLGRNPELDLRVIAIASRPGDSSDPTFDSEILEGLSTQLIERSDASDVDLLKKHLSADRPDVIVMSGWEFDGYLQLIQTPAYAEIPVIVCSDNPIRHTWRQRFGFYKIRWLLDRASKIVVTGEAAYQLMKYWRVSESKIAKGLYGVDESSLSKCTEMRDQQAWPRKFVFTGRYSRRKGVDLLIEGYQRYRSEIDQPWGLICCGRGELDQAVGSSEGVENCGFIQPADLPHQLARASAFVLASRSDAWPLSLVEAAVAGLPIICTSACGSSAELTRDLFNGRVIPPQSVAAICDAMHWMHQQQERLPVLGQRSRELAMPYTSSEWAYRWGTFIDQLTRDGR